MLYQYALTLLPPELALSGRFTVTRTFCPWFDGRSNPDLTPPAEFATFRSMNALLQTGSSLSACGHAQAGGRVSVPLKSDFLSIAFYVLAIVFDVIYQLKSDFL